MNKQSSIDRAAIVQQVCISLLSQSGPDFTTKTLSELIGIRSDEISRIAAQGRIYGSYKVGGDWRFRRAEILFYRAMGQDVFKPTKKKNHLAFK